jgi:hypothetical protein
MNQLYIGFTRSLELPKGSFLFIDDEVPKHPKAKVFDPLKHSFNPLRNIDRKKARSIAAAIYAASPQGENTLTLRNGRRALAHALAETPRLDKVHVQTAIKGVQEEVEGMLDDVLFTDVVRRALCSEDDFAFTGHNTKVFARINRADLGEYDALVLGLLLIENFKGQIIVPDFGFYGRDIHANLIRENRLIVGINFLDELPDKLRQSVLLIKDKKPSGATFEDAVTLARYKNLQPNTNEYNDELKEAMA